MNHATVVHHIQERQNKFKKKNAIHLKIFAIIKQTKVLKIKKKKIVCLMKGIKSSFYK